MKKGFTLIELLIVIAIISILLSVLILVINPPEIFKRGNDTQRLADATNLKNGLMAYIAQRGTFNVETLPCGTSENPCRSNCCVEGGSYVCGDACTDPTRIDGTGWIPLNFETLPLGTPFNQLPIDPLNRGDYIYRFAADDGDFEIDPYFESKHFREKLRLPLEDGGNSEELYEVGTRLNILGGRIAVEETVVIDFTGDSQIASSNNIAVSPDPGQVTLAPGP